GWAQVHYGYANSLEEETEKMRYDLYYIKHRSIWLDLWLLFATSKILVKGEEAILECRTTLPRAPRETAAGRRSQAGPFRRHLPSSTRPPSRIIAEPETQSWRVRAEWWRPEPPASAEQAMADRRGAVPFWALIAFTTTLLIAPQQILSALAPLHIAALAIA